MTSATGPWPTLEIAPTFEIRDIRRAYARLLKTINVEAEADRFVALREAFEQALALAKAVPVYEPTRPEPALVQGDDVRWSSSDQPKSDAPSEQPPPSIAVLPSVNDTPQRLAAIEQANAHAQALERLLLSQEHDGISASSDEATMMIGHWEAIAADPRWEELSHYAQAEGWLSDTVARGSPFSDPLVPIVANHFGWIANAATLGQSSAIRYIVDRYASLVFLEAISRKSHSLHRAWVELTTPADSNSRRGWRVSRTSVIRLLQLVRRDQPVLEGHLDSWRVSLWEDVAPKRRWVIWLIVVVAVNLLRLCAGSSNIPLPVSVPTAVAADELNMASLDIDRVLKALSANRTTAAMVTEINPALYGDMLDQWRQMHASGNNFWDFQADVSEALNQRLKHVYDKAPYRQIAAFRQTDLEAAQYYRKISVAACDGFFNGTIMRTAQPAALVARRQNAVYDILLYSGVDRPGYLKRKSFPIPPAILSKALLRSSMSRTDFLAAMHGEGTAQQRCDARIAFLQVGLSEPPKQGLSILRNM